MAGDAKKFEGSTETGEPTEFGGSTKKKRPKELGGPSRRKGAKELSGSTKRKRQTELKGSTTRKRQIELENVSTRINLRKKHRRSTELLRRSTEFGGQAKKKGPKELGGPSKTKGPTEHEEPSMSQEFKKVLDQPRILHIMDKNTNRGHKATTSRTKATKGDEVTATPIKMECRQKVGVEGGKLQLETFGIELDIPPGAIDSETPQEISLRVLTDTRILGNNKEEILICYGIQCMVPDDLVLTSPVYFTIPHCAVLSRLSGIKIVLYCGEGEYTGTPEPIVKERIELHETGLTSCVITEDRLILKVTHFSWYKIQSSSNDSFLGKRLGCMSFVDEKVSVQKAPIILRTYLYDDIKGNKSKTEALVKGAKCVSEEEKILIKAEAGNLKVSCSVNNQTPNKEMLSLDNICHLRCNCVPFKLNTKKSSDALSVLMKVGQQPGLEKRMMFDIERTRIFTRSIGTCTSDQGLQATSSLEDLLKHSNGQRRRSQRRRNCVSKTSVGQEEFDEVYHDSNRKDSGVSHMVKMGRTSTTQAISSPKSKDKRSLTPSPNKKAKLSVPMTSARQKDFDEMLKTVAKRVRKDEDIDDLGKALKFEPEDIYGFIATNKKGPYVSYMGTLNMLRDWCDKQTPVTERPALWLALEEAGQRHLAAELFGS